jgi:hypothetical protein
MPVTKAFSRFITANLVSIPSAALAAMNPGTAVAGAEDRE